MKRHNSEGCYLRFRILCHITVCLFLLLSGCHRISRAPVSIKPDLLEQWISYLASDKMQGRANGSEQTKEAAFWIADQFKQFGLKPAPGQNSYIQQYNFTHWYVRTIQERNVIGYLKGADPDLQDEYIIISAHFDHLGIKSSIDGDSIYNGADDDASGIAAMLGIAHIIKSKRAKPGRSIVFIAFSGEEIGLRGSKYYVQNPQFPLEATYLNINFEMLGQCKNLGKCKYYITGPSFSNIDEIVEQYNSTGRWQIDESVKNAERLFLQADNKSFAVVKKQENITYGIPAHTFSFYNGEDHLHKPHDEAQLLDYQNMASFVNYMAKLTLHLADLPQKIQWTNENYRHISELP